MNLAPRNPKNRTPLPPPLPPSGAVLGEGRERLARQADRELWTRIVLAVSSGIVNGSPTLAPTCAALIAEQSLEVLRAVKMGPDGFVWAEELAEIQRARAAAAERWERERRAANASYASPEDIPL